MLRKDMRDKHILFIGYRGKDTHTASFKQEGGRVSLLIGADEMKEEYEEEFEEIIVLNDLYDWSTLEATFSKRSYDGIQTRYEDFTVIAAALADLLGLPGVSMEHARKFRNKYLMQKAFKECGVPSADFVLITSPDDAEEFLKNHNFPLILKQIAGIHSKFVTKVHTKEELEETLARFQNDIQESADNLQKRLSGHPVQGEEPDPLTHFLLEECMSGLELTVDSFVSGGQVSHIPICKYVLSEDVGFNDHHLPIRLLPYDLSEQQQQLIFETVERGYRALGADNCVTHAEVFFSPEDNRCQVIEIAARGGGFRAEMLKSATGEDYDLAACAVCLGQTPQIGLPPKTHAAVCEVFAPENGTLISIDTSCLDERDDVFSVTHNKNVGDSVGRASDGRSFVMKFLLEGETYDDLEREAVSLLMRIRDSIVVEAE